MFKPLKNSVNILGTKYTITIKDYKDDKFFQLDEAAGYCAFTDKAIVICNMETFPNWDNESERACENSMKTTLRHEIIYAFLNESGLAANSNETEAWARNEEMVDWFAIQGPKIAKIWQEVGTL